MTTRDRTALMHDIRVYSFAITETTLFLDTHPDDCEALECYHKYNSLLEEAYTEYESRFGPLTIYGGTDCDRWNWIDSPWPWEYAANTAC